MKNGKRVVNFIKKYDTSNYNYFCKLRFEKSINECKKFFLENKENPYVKQKIKNIYFPNTMEVLGRRMEYNNNVTLKELLEWDYLILCFNHKIINDYLLLKEQYEKYFFSMRYQEAWLVLCEIEKKCGISMWLIEQQVGVLYNLDMKEEVEQLVLAYQRCTKNNGLLSNILKFIQWRKNPEISYSDYMQYTENTLLQRNEKSLDTKYLRDKILLNKEHTKDNFQFILQIDETFSAIDLYETLIETLFLLTHQKDCELELSELKAITMLIKDRRLNAMLLHSGEFSHLPEDYFQQSELFEILEKYSSCKWQETEILLNKYLQEKPEDFMMHHLFVKCRMFQNQDLEEKHEIEVFLYELYTMQKKPVDLKTTFQDYWKKFYGTSWQYKVKAILYRKILCREDEFSRYVAVCYDYQITPMYVKILETGVRENFLNMFKEVCPVTVELILKQYGLLSKPVIIAEKMKEYYVEICFMQEKRQYELLVQRGNYALEHLDYGENAEHYNNHKAYFYYKGRICRYLFNGLLQTKKIKEAIHLFGEVFFQKELLVQRFDIQVLISMIEDVQDREGEMDFMQSIYAPIIYHYYYGNEGPERTIIAYRDFLYFNNVQTLDEWMEKIDIVSEVETYFLYNVCTTSLIERDHRTMYQYGTAISARICILRFLLEKDPCRRKRYVDELNRIYSSQQLEKRVELIHKDKIHVEVKKIYESLEEFLKIEFEKYALHQKLQGELVDDETSDIGSDGQIEESIMNNELRYCSEHKFYQYIIDKVIEEYLLNKSYGLSTYIGTRIRHNYCKQNLFSVFEKRFLLSKKEKNNSSEYMINSYWSDIIDVDKESQLLDILSVFSKKMNQKHEEVTNEWLQIRTSEQSGMFDYTGLGSWIYNYTHIFKNSYETAFYTVIKELNSRTKEILEQIRERVDNELKTFFDEQMNWLKNEVSKIELSDKTSSLLSFHISKCQEEIPETIRNFRDIFYYEDISYPVFNIGNVIDCYVEIFKRLYPDISDGFLICSLATNKDFSGQYFPYWIDIMGILFQNAKEYSGWRNFSDAKFTIKTRYINEEGKEWLSVEASNLLQNQTEEKLKELHGKMKLFLENIEKNRILEKSTQEHGSGFYKIARIVKYNFETEAFYGYKATLNDFTFEFKICIK